MLLLFIALPLLTCNKPSKPTCLNLPRLSLSVLLWELCTRFALRPKPLEQQNPDCPWSPACALRLPLSSHKPPPPPLLAFSALSNVSKVTKMFSESRLLGAKRGQAHFLSHPSLSILLFHDTKWSVNETQKSCQGKKNSALKTKETKKTRHRFL